MKNYDPVLRVVAKVMIPFILLFALYVQWHGDFGPGGGFQAGVILAAGFIFYSLIYGLDTTKKILSPLLLERLIALGILLYLAVGVAGLLLGGNFLDYFVLDENALAGQHLGIFLVELGVGITVFAVMLTIFYMFAGRGRID